MHCFPAAGVAFLWDAESSFLSPVALSPSSLAWNWRPFPVCPKCPSFFFSCLPGPIRWVLPKLPWAWVWMSGGSACLAPQQARWGMSSGSVAPQPGHACLGAGPSSANPHAYFCLRRSWTVSPSTRPWCLIGGMCLRHIDWINGQAAQTALVSFWQFPFGVNRVRLCSVVKTFFFLIGLFSL